MKRALIAGYFGFGNAGDELILSGMLASLREAVPDLAATVVSGDPDETRYLHGVEGVHWQDIASLMAAVEAADLVIVGGGGLFQDYWGVKPETYLTPSHGDITFYGAFPLLANLYGKPCMTYSVGIGPIGTPAGDEHTLRALRQCDEITVRDPQSLRFAERAGRASLAADPAFALAPASSQAALTAAGTSFDWKRRPLLGVSVRHWGDEGAGERLFESLALTLDRFVDERSGQVLFLPFQHPKGTNPLEDDVHASQEVRRRMRRAVQTRIVSHSLRLEVLAALVSQCDAILGMRLHAVLLAFAHGVPSIGIAYDPKVARVFAEAGLEFLSVDPATLSPERLQPLLTQITAAPARIQEAVRDFGNRQRALATVPARLARQLLDRPQAPRTPRSQALLDFIKDLVSARSALESSLFRLQTESRAVSSRLEEAESRLAAERSAHQATTGRLALAEGALAAERERARSTGPEEASLRQHAANLTADKASLTARVRELEAELSGIYRSNGWKLLVRLWDLKRSLTGKKADAPSAGAPSPEPAGGSGSPLGDGKAATRREESGASSPGSPSAAPSTPASAEASAAHPAPLSLLTHEKEEASPGSEEPRSGPGTVVLPGAGAIQADPRKPHDLDPVSELQRILDASGDRRPIVVFPPSVGWDIPLFQRPQQMALAYARLGCLVFYCDYECTLGKGFHEVVPGLYRTDVPIETFRSLPEVLLVILSYNRHWIPYFTDPVVIYEYIDDLDVFTVDDREQLKRDHDVLLSESAIVVATARRLWEAVLPHRSDALLCPNGVDYEHFAPAQGLTTAPPPVDLKPFLLNGRREMGVHNVPLLRAKSPVIGYYGALARWFDYELVRESARLRRDWSFVLIGPPYDFVFEESGIVKEPNLFWLGQKPYRELPLYLRHFDVATIPFILDPITHATSPLKLFEYMAGGKPVVTTAMEESLRFPGVLAARGRTAPEAAGNFIARIEEALSLRENPEYRLTIDRVARENTWEERARSILRTSGAPGREE